MNLPSRVGAFVIYLCCAAGAPVVAEVPPSTPPASQPAPAPAPSDASAPTSVSDATAPAAPIDPAKEAEIRKLLKTTGTVKMVNQMLQEMMGAFQGHASGLPKEFWEQLQKDMSADKLVEKLIPVYDKYYSLDDLKAVNAFYETPAGQHLLQVQPQILHDSMAIGQEWGRQAGMKAMVEIQDYKQRMENAQAASNNASQPAQPAPRAPASTPSTPPTP